MNKIDKKLMVGSSTSVHKFYWKMSVGFCWNTGNYFVEV